MNRFAGTAIAMLVAAIAPMVAGCQPSGQPSPMPTMPSASRTPASPSPVPTPTYLCTPEAGGDESPCSQIQYEEMKAKDALYEEAEAVFREFFSENIRISRAGGVTEPTEVLLRTTTGSVHEAVMEVFRDMSSRGVHAEGDDPVLTIARAPGLSRDGSLVALQVCVDASRWGFYSGGKLVSTGRGAQERVYFARLGELLKMAYSEGKWVETCPTAGD